MLDTPLETEMSYVLSDEGGEGPMAPALRGASEDVMGSLATTIRFGEGLVDGVLTTTDGGDQLIIHRRGAEAEVIEPMASVQALNDLAACDLNGDGRDEISVVKARATTSAGEPRVQSLWVSRAPGANSVRQRHQLRRAQ